MPLLRSRAGHSATTLSESSSEPAVVDYEDSEHCDEDAKHCDEDVSTTAKLDSMCLQLAHKTRTMLRFVEDVHMALIVGVAMGGFLGMTVAAIGFGFALAMLRVPSAALCGIILAMCACGHSNLVGHMHIGLHMRHLCADCSVLSDSFVASSLTVAAISAVTPAWWMSIWLLCVQLVKGRPCSVHWPMKKNISP